MPHIHPATLVGLMLVPLCATSIWFSRHHFLTRPVTALNAVTQRPSQEEPLKDAEAYLKRGKEHYGKKNYDSAIADYTEAIKHNPNSAEAHYNRGYVYEEKGNHDQAIMDYTQVIKLEPNLAEVHCNQGMVYGQKGDYDREPVDYTQAIKLNPKDADAYHRRGYA
jgi:tetratricopeptide (TPR) repeat protein